MLLYAARHAQVAVRADAPREEWHLSPEGAESARRLAREGRWEGVAVLHHSPEPKAAETAAAIGEVLGARLVPAPDLRELHMDPVFLPTDVFERRVGAYLGGAADPGFEDYAEAQRRVLACVRAVVAGAAGRPAAIVSHGRLLTVLFSALCGERLGAAEWRSIRLPDLSVVDLAAGHVVRGFFAGRRVDPSLLAGGA
jgi:2,3-bisphosphoglycerate-dependent phosphoglycerate mutase